MMLWLDAAKTSVLPSGCANAGAAAHSTIPAKGFHGRQPIVALK